jgi:glucose-1-phosphate thymidylyltransferase
MKALILAAGYATRLYPLTADTPKALLPLGDKPMLDYLMESLVSIPQLEGVHLVTNHRFAAQFEAWAEQAQARYGALTPRIWDDGTTSNENRLGAIGDMDFVIEKAGIKEDLLVAVSDNFFTFDLNDFYRAFVQSGQDAVCAQPMDDGEMIKSFAVASLDERGTIVEMEEKPAHPKSNLAVYGLYLYRRDTLPLIKRYLREGNSPDSQGHFPAWLYKLRPVHAYLFPGECVDIGTVETYQAVNSRYEKQQG